ncbi:MAG: protein kinase [Anaerolineales bacterium]|jgi:serine/threonine-protein kinase
MKDDAQFPTQKLLGGRYRILRRLGVGGMAEVLQAHDLNLQRDVAIKLLHDELIHDPAFQARFLQEARAAANLLHPNIVTVHDFGHDQGRYFIVMEHVEGTDLKTLLSERAPLAADEAMDLMVQICAGIGYAHRAGLVHCDLKPQNILITYDIRAKITDFGIARALASVRPDETSETVWGSPQYIAPEQAAGSLPAPTSDVYSLGVILFEMLTGHLPFHSEDPTKLAEMHQTQLPPLPRTFNPAIPETLELLILKVLSKEPSLRYRNADQFGQVLAAYKNRLMAEEAAQLLLEREPGEPSSEDPSSRVAVAASAQLDWLAVGLALLAFLAVGGLIPLWLWVCMLYPSCPLVTP